MGLSLKKREKNSDKSSVNKKKEKHVLKLHYINEKI